MGEAYATPSGVEAAIKEAARRASTEDTSVSVSERIRQEHFRRFLSRVFSDDARSEWLLKGGTGVLARVPSARATKDVDLYREGYTLDEALVDLQRLAKIDLDDHFRFEYASHIDSLTGPEQPYAEGYSVIFDVYIGPQRRGRLRVDLSVGAGITDDADVIHPANALDLPRLISHDYRVYPVVDQIADKLCATHMLYSGAPSSRQKDLVDLVVFATTHDVRGLTLRVAIESEARRRGLERIDRVQLPDTWGREYARMAKKVPQCEGFTDIGSARRLMEAFLDPVLRGRGRREILAPRAPSLGLAFGAMHPPSVPSAFRRAHGAALDSTPGFVLCRTPSDAPEPCIPSPAAPPHQEFVP